ncbi:MAG: hypothetical protein ABIT09_06690 [Croceibacterium sp.]
MTDGAATARDFADTGDELGDEAVSSVFAAARHVRPVIEVRAGEIHLMATEAESALLTANAPLFVRGGLVRPIVDVMPAANGRRAKVARLAEVDGDCLIDHLSRSADWVKFNARKRATVSTDPPRNVAMTILARDGEWRFRKLSGVITTQTLRPDGTVLADPGYDDRTQLLLLEPPTMPIIAARPSRADALAGLALLDRLLDEFPFVDGASRSVALSALITPVVRGAVSVAPMHTSSAPVAGSGKSYVIDLASAISTGERAPVIAAGRTEEETEKRLGAALLNGQSIISIDNVNGELGGDMLCQMIERPIVAIRPLGSSKLIKIESRATVFSTGNNIRLVGDMTRRVILCSLDPNMERPELRQFAARPFDMVVADRGKYIAAALTICRAYAVADFPGELAPLASFEDWSRIVRSALVWLGRPDPVHTMEAARAEDPVTSSLRSVYQAWYEAVGSTRYTSGKIREVSEEKNPFGNSTHGDLHRALCEAADDRRGGIDSRQLGKWLGCHKGRVVDGLKLEAHENPKLKQKEWSVVRV